MVKNPFSFSDNNLPTYTPFPETRGVLGAFKSVITAMVHAVPSPDVIFSLILPYISAKPHKEHHSYPFQMALCFSE